MHSIGDIIDYSCNYHEKLSITVHNDNIMIRITKKDDGIYSQNIISFKCTITEPYKHDIKYSQNISDLQYYESHLKLSFRKIYGNYNDLECNYKLSLDHILNALFRTLC
jgi:hypothetical protein